MQRIPSISNPNEKKTMIWVCQQYLYVGSEPIDGRCVHILAYSMLQRSEVVSTYPRHAAHAPQSMPFAHKRLILPRFGDFWPWAPMCYVSRVCFFLDRPLVFVGSLIGSRFHIGQRRLSDATDTLHLQSQRKKNDDLGWPAVPIRRI